MLPQALKRLGTLRLKAARFCKDRRGVAAVEFAFLAPILLMMYFLTMEASQAIETNKKVSRLGSMVADLVAQNPGSIDKAAIQSIMDIGQTTLLPYARSKPTITVTGLRVESSAPEATVVWSRKLNNGTFGPGLAKDDKLPIPPALAIEGTFLVKVDSNLTYEPLIVWVAGGEQLGLLNTFKTINMGETYLLRPRTVSQLTCSDC
ncbi:TadE/TadG family type IV pilus assembly protein [Mesorhizobium sp. NPDC059054]|uniref:TadE/TadG family type IV pilus assembly protein n=1 Tax=Mesorhizobium sp. NPDC059054 TaxID=3346711 RepID=UPI0036860AA4